MQLTSHIIVTFRIWIANYDGIFLQLKYKIMQKRHVSIQYNHGLMQHTYLDIEMQVAEFFFLENLILIRMYFVLTPVQMHMTSYFQDATQLY